MNNFFKTIRKQNIAFIGAGVAHKELILLFASYGANVTLCDEKNLNDFEREYAEELNAKNINLSLGENYLDGLENQNMILRTPGFYYHNKQLQAAMKAGAKVTSEIELFFENCNCQTVGVTGSDGKTTTTSLIAAMYENEGRKVHIGGNIGRAMLPLINEISSKDVAVVELSSFQLISMKHSPNIAIVTNVSPNHLDHHRNMDEYTDAKRNILAWQNYDDVAVLNYENVITRTMQKDVAGDIFWFSRLREVRDGAFLDENNYLCLAKNGVATQVVPANEVKLRGEHNIDNLLAAFAAMKNEVSVQTMKDVATQFVGVEHRLEPVRMLNNVLWFNDSIATSPTRVIAGLRSFSNKIILIAGGYDKNIPFEPMTNDILEKVKLLILMGPASKKIEKAVKDNPGFKNRRIIIEHAKDLQHAVTLAYQYASAGDVVTLSPACASFDAFENFEERGNKYKEMVLAL